MASKLGSVPRFVQFATMHLGDLNAKVVSSRPAFVTKVTRSTRSELDRLAGIWHGSGKAAIDRNRLAVDIGGLVAEEEQAHRRQLARLAGPLERIELADLALSAAFLGAVENRLGHACFDQAGAYGIDPHAGARQGIGRGLYKADDAGLARGVGVAAGARFQTGNRRGAENGSRTLFDHVRYRMIDGQERTDQVDPQDFLPMLHRLLRKRNKPAADPGIGPDRV